MIYLSIFATACAALYVYTGFRAERKADLRTAKRLEGDFRDPRWKEVG